MSTYAERYLALHEALGEPAAITLPIAAGGRIELREAPGSARCSTGCRTKGGGLLLLSPFDEKDQPRGHVTICGKCLALALVDRIGQVAASKGGVA